MESDPGVNLTLPLLEGVLTASQHGGSPLDSLIIVCSIGFVWIRLWCVPFFRVSVASWWSVEKEK